MKKPILFIILLVAESFAQAQGTLYVSNLGQSPFGSMAIGSDSWIAQIFFTGTNSGGYNLDSVQLLMSAASGSPREFSVSIYSSLAPISKLANLYGSDPSAGGIFTYTTSNLILSPSTDYYVTVTSETPVTQGAYVWSAANNITAGNNGWFIGGIYYKSSDGLNWDYSRQYGFQLGITATPIPEPATMALVALGLACLSVLRLRLAK